MKRHSALIEYRPSSLAVDRAIREGNETTLEIFALFTSLAQDEEARPFFTITEPGHGHKRPLASDPSITIEAVLFYNNSRGFTDERGTKIGLGFEDQDGGAKIEIYEHTASELVIDPYSEMIISYFRRQYPDSLERMAKHNLVIF